MTMATRLKIQAVKYTIELSKAELDVLNSYICVSFPSSLEDMETETGCYDIDHSGRLGQAIFFTADTEKDAGKMLRFIESLEDLTEE